MEMLTSCIDAVIPLLQSIIQQNHDKSRITYCSKRLFTKVRMIFMDSIRYIFERKNISSKNYVS